VLLSDALSRYTFWGIDSFGANTPFLLTQGAPASGLVLGTPAYSNDGGSSWTYTRHPGPAEPRPVMTATSPTGASP